MAQENVMPDASAQQAPAETVEQPNQTGEGQVQPEVHTSGIQKRIDELTAQKYEEKRRADAIQQQLLDSQAQMARMMEMITNQQVVAPQPNPADDLDPEARRAMEALMAPKYKALEARVAHMDQLLERQEFQARASSEHPDVVARANQLYSHWQKIGAAGFKMVDALVYAKGELAGVDQTAASRARNERGQYTASAANVMQSQSAPPPPVARTSGLPADIDRRPLDEQLRLYEQHLDGKTF